MYIAFKWLVFLSLVMWLAMCLSDVYIKYNKANIDSVMDDIKPSESLMQNETLVLDRNFDHAQYQKLYDGIFILHGTMCIAGALAVMIFNRKTEFILYTRIKLSKLNIRAFTKNSVRLLCEAFVKANIAIDKYLRIFRKKKSTYITKINALFSASKINQVIHNTLLNKFKEKDEEKKHLCQMLIAVIHENKNIKTQYQLEAMAKCRLVHHMQNIRESRSRYVSFQQLYLITHKKNAYLKARIGKLTREKNEAENNLMVLINEIYQSRSKELKDFCSHFIVKTKNSILNCDVNAEIKNFLEKPKSMNRIVQDGINSCPSCSYDTVNFQEKSIVPLVADSPKLKGLPGEFVWTVKDKNGIIEKLYECDYESDYDYGDTIRRIRQYSVYYDKDCLLDFSNSRAVIQESNANSIRNRFSNNHNFLTGSKAFQRFLNYNENIAINSSSLTSSFAQRLFCR